VQSIRERFTRFDVLGISLGIPGIFLFTYALTSANTQSWNDIQIIAALAVSVRLLDAFIQNECCASEAILAPHLFRNMSFNLTLVLAINTYAVRQACTYFSTV
jgi:predicted NBD/HSP70 family sugar kinase